ncbi:MAG TPA: transcription antitermination factor NusB [Candidatus Enterenecus stercoripullorum]|nr:transcription antitermination factor NusB [Candidatus Enterenecus stercoripullorum]
MTRTIAREIAMHLAFEQAFSNLEAEELLDRELTPEAFESRKKEEPLYSDFPDEEQRGYIAELVKGVAQRRAELDSRIEQYAKDWRVARIDRVAACVMRVAMYEILYLPQVPDKVAINEAVEIAKKYLDTDVVGFVNGILGSLVREEYPQEQGPAGKG